MKKNEKLSTGKKLIICLIISTISSSFIALLENPPTIIVLIYIISGLYFWILFFKFIFEKIKSKNIKNTTINNNLNIINNNFKIENDNFAKEENLAKIIDIFKEQTKKECYSIILMKEKPEITDSKIGGKPYLPVGEDYPTDKNGNTLAFLLQINLKDIDLEEYPKEGFLVVYTNPCCYDINEYVIKYYEKISAYQENFPDVDLSEHIVKESYKIKLTKAHCYMPISDYRFENTIGTIIRNFYNVNPDDNKLLYQILGMNNWMEKVNENISNPLITIGGYPEFINEDPRSYENSEMTECLFKIDSNRNPNIIINDLGILNFVIKKSDINNKKFDKALLYSE